MADEIIKYQFETNADEVAKEVDKLNKGFKGLDATFEDVYGDIKPLTGRLGEIEDRMYQLAQAGDTASAEFRELSKEASRLKNVQKEVDLQLDRTSRTLTEKFNAGVNLVTGSMVIAEGAMTAMGVGAETSEELMADMFKAMAVGQAAMQIEESTGVFTRMGAAIAKTTVYQKMSTAAQWLWNAAMSANPIGVLVVAIAAVVAGIVSLMYWFEESAEEAERSALAQKKAIDKIKGATEELTKAQQKNIDEQKKSFSLEVDMLKAMGASTTAIRKKTLSILEQNKALAKTNMQESLNAKGLAELLATAYGGDTSSEEFKALQKAATDAAKLYDLNVKAYEQSEEDIRLVKKTFKIQDEQAKTDAINLAIQQARDKKKREIEEVNSANEEYTTSLLSFRAQEEKIVNDKYTRLITFANKHGLDTKQLIAAQKAQLQVIVKKYADLEVQAEKDKNKELNDIYLRWHAGDLERKIAAIETQAEHDAIVLKNAGATADAVEAIWTAAYSQIDALVAGANDTILGADDNEGVTGLEKKLSDIQEMAQLTNDILDGFMNVSTSAHDRRMSEIQAERDAILHSTSMTDEQKRKSIDKLDKIEKAAKIKQIKRERDAFAIKAGLALTMALAESGMTAAKSVGDATMSIGAFTAALGPWGIAAWAASIGGTIASIISARNAAESEINSLSATGARVSGGGGSGRMPSMPTFNTVGQSAASSSDVANGAQAQINGANDNPTRAYVVSTDITSQQALDRATESQGELG